MSGAVLALDQGTTSSRALVIAADGRVLASARQELTSTYPRPGWVEQDPLEIWSTQHQTAVEALRRCGLGPADIAAVGIANQRETTIVWERATGRPVAPALVWQDRRTVGACEALRHGAHEELLRERTGLLADPYFSATKLQWVLESVPQARRRAERGELAFGTVDSWLIWNLTGGRLHVTDATNASRTLLYDIRLGTWSQELLELFGIPGGMLPQVVDSCGLAGETAADVFGAPLPIAGIAGDQQAALFGQCCTLPGMAKVTYGTGCFLLLHAGDDVPDPPDGLLATVALQRNGVRTYALEGSVFVAGAALDWLCELLSCGEAARLVELAASVPSSDGVVVVPALAGLGAPHWQPLARGAVLGLTLGSTRAHVARATLQGIALQVDELVAAAAAAGVRPFEIRADGGACTSDLLMQMQADLLEVPVLRAAHSEATALGAAYLAGLAAGVWASEDELRRSWHHDRRFEPRAPSDADLLRRDWQAAVRATVDFAHRKESS